MKTSSDDSSGALPIEARSFLGASSALVDHALNELVPAETTQPLNVHRAIRWSLFAGGKRFRPALVFAVGGVFGANVDDLMKTACALEMVHTYSLIHDDLPSMDDDELRRGRPTCHVQFNEAIAILAGDALQTLAFQAIADDEKLTPAIRLQVLGELARAAGTPLGMVAGQASDLDAESREVTGADLEIIHRLKTGALICAAARTGAIIAGASVDQLDAVTSYAAYLGLLFQITDDLLDVTASAEALGKTPGKDVRSRKATYPSLYGLESTRERAREAYEKACESLDRIEHPADLLRSIAEYILERRM